MARLLSVLLWTTVFLLSLLALDQLLVRVPASLPAHAAVADFYRDLRTRAFDLVKGVKTAPAPAKPAAPARAKEPSPPASVEAVIAQRQAKPAPSPGKPAAPPSASKEASLRYVYADARGEIHFAETLAEVPAEYREKAKRLGE